MQCQACGSIVGENARFCRACGEPISRSRNCPLCESEVGSSARFCRKCGASLDSAAAPVVERGTVQTGRARGRSLPIIGGALVVVFLLAVAGLFVFMTRGEEGGTPASPVVPGSSTTLVASSLGSGSVQASPEQGGVVTAGIARVEIRPLALAEPATISATLNADRSLDISIEPQAALRVPALVTLPLPAGAEAGEDPSKWPVVLLESPGQDPLVIEPDAVSDSTFAVLVPHFSKATPMLQGAANAKVGGASAGSGKPFMPAVIDAKVGLPENNDPGAEVSQVLITVSAKARTSENGGVPKMDGGQLGAGWERFGRLRVRVYESTEGLKAGALPIADQELTNGGPITFPVSVRWGDDPLRAAYIRLEDEAGRLLVVRSLVLPNGKYWKELACSGAGDYEEFNVHYLWDPRSTGFPDANYAANAAAKGLVPARVFDSCEALTYAYRLYKNPRWFGAGNLPSMPMEVWLQPWRENESGNVRNWISLRTSAGNYDEFKRDAAHEMAHRFQHQYSIGYGGGWFHDASAEYLANRIYGPDEEIARFIGLSPAWITNGMMDGGDIDAYSASSFLAYLSSTYGINVAKLWTEGATGLGNLQSWQSYLDAVLRPKTNNVGISKAWDDFSRAYLVDHSTWGDWTGADLDSVFVARGNLTLGGGKPYYGINRRPVPYLSAGGVLVKFSGAPSATIVYRVALSSSRWSHYWLNPGVVIDGRGEPISLDDTRPPSKSGSFKLGATKDSIDDRGVARLTYSFGDFEGGDAKNSELVVEAWALPEVVGVEQSDVGGLLKWPASPVEKMADNEKRSLFDGYEVVAQRKDRPGTWAVLQTEAGGKENYEYTIDAAALARAGATLPVCIRVKDVLGNAGTEGCPSAGATSFQITGATFAEAGVIKEPLMVNVGLPYWRHAEANPTACRIDIEDWKDGREVVLSCVFVPGCAADQDCFTWPLATNQTGLVGNVSVTPAGIEGELCNGLSGGDCVQRMSIDATFSAGQLTGTFGIYSSYAGTSGTITFNFTATPKR